MSFLTRWFRKEPTEDYEVVLSGLAADVQRRQTRLAEIRLRQRRTTLQFTLGTFFIWFAYVSLWYTRTLPSTWHDSKAGTAAMVVGPVLILFARRMMQIWYLWKGNREEKTLKEVLKRQRDTIEDIKKKTNYYNTRILIEKYDEALPPSPEGVPFRRRNVPSVSIPQTPVRLQPPPLPTPRQQLDTPNGQVQGPVLQLSPTPRPIEATRKQWYDKLADAILGDDDDHSATVAASRYALICQKCFAHNGLVKENEWEDTQYTCPKCGSFNPSARSKKRAAQRTPSPPSSQHPSPDQAPQQLPATVTPPPKLDDKSYGTNHAGGDDSINSMQMDVE